MRWGLIGACAAAFGLGGVVLAKLLATDTEIGAWTWAALDHPDRSVASAKALGLGRVDIMINGYTNPAWHMADAAKIRRCVAAFRAAGIKVSLTTWIRPSAEWISGMARDLAPLAAELGVDLTLDAEEPWIGPLTNADAATIVSWSAQAVQALRAHWNGDLAVSCIVYTYRRVMDPLIALCDTVIPQCYATIANVPSGPPGHLEKTTADFFADSKKRIVMGAALWNLDGAYGLPGREALRASLAAAVAAGIPRVRFWHLENVTLAAGDVRQAWADARATKAA